MEVTINLSEIDGWETGVAVGIELKEKLDQTHLTLGMLANHLCPVRKAGRQAKENKPQTVSALAKQIGVDRSWLSNAANNAEFFKEHLEKVPPQASIGMLNRARKLTGGSPARPVTKKPTGQAIKSPRGRGEEPVRIPPSAIAHVRMARKK